MKHQHRITCVVPECKSWSFNSAAVSFFPVPPRQSITFAKWSKLIKLSGRREERICEVHFRNCDFIRYSRRKLKPGAIPSAEIPKCATRIKSKIGCCVSGCSTKTRKRLIRFPSSKNPNLLRTWKNVFLIHDEDDTNYRICGKHFNNCDYVTVHSLYLRPSAVPSIKVQRHVSNPRKNNQNTKKVLMHDHTYCRSTRRSGRYRTCTVSTCKSRASATITLHSIPRNERYIEWKKALRLNNISKSSKVCSEHFTKADYIPGGKHLKSNAVPSRNLPIDNELLKHNPYNKPRVSYRREAPLTDTKFDENAEYIGGESTIATHAPEPAAGVTCNAEKPTSTKNRSAEPQAESLKHEPGYDADELNNRLAAEQIEKLLQSEKSNDNVDTNCSQNITVTTNDLEMSLKRDTKVQFKFVDLLETDDDLNTWTGLPSFVLLQELCLAAKKLENSVYLNKFSMHCTDRVILVFVKLKQNLSFAAMAILFKIHISTVSKYFDYTVQILSQILSAFVYMPEKEEILQNIPHCFKGKFANVTIVLDCTEIPLATLKCLNCRLATYSQYKSRRTIKILIGVSPAGLITFCSKAYSGKASDKFIFNQENLIAALNPHIDEVMVDKGFTIDNELSIKGIKLHIPPFMRNDRLTASQAALNESIAKARIHVERVMQRLKIFSVLQDTVDTYIAGNIDDIMTIICGIVNLTRPILRDDKF